MFLALAVSPEVILLLDFKEEVGAVVEENAFVSVDDVQRLSVEKGLDKIAVFGKDRKGAIDAVELQFRLAQELSAGLDCAFLGRRFKYSHVDECGQDVGKVVFKAGILPYLAAQPVEMKIVEDALQEEVASADKCLLVLSDEP